MQSADFWLREAHLNGISDDAMIRGMIDPDKAPVIENWSILGVDEGDIY